MGLVRRDITKDCHSLILHFIGETSAHPRIHRGHFHLNGTGDNSISKIEARSNPALDV